MKKTIIKCSGVGALAARPQPGDLLAVPNEDILDAFALGARVTAKVKVRRRWRLVQAVIAEHDIRGCRDPRCCGTIPIMRRSVVAA